MKKMASGNPKHDTSHSSRNPEIAVGSKNPAKLRAVRNAVQQVWPKATIETVDAPSGVRDQPLNDDEAIQGAVNRALFSRVELDADFGLGLEGSVADTVYGMFLCGWVAVVDRSFLSDLLSVPHKNIQSAVLAHSGISLACTSRILLPTTVAEQIRAGGELGPVMDKLTQRTDTKHAQGANGILTDGLIQRADSFEQGVIFALARYITPDYYTR